MKTKFNQALLFIGTVCALLAVGGTLILLAVAP